MRPVKFDEISDIINKQLPKGAFLTVRDRDGRLNTMTIGWGSVGYMWFKTVFVAMVRKSRYTFDLIENANDFTVNVPLNDQLKEALKFCGTKSGRDFDKFKEANLTPIKAQETFSDVIEECELNIECKILYKQAIDDEYMSGEIRKIYGPEKDYHTYYYGEIVSCYFNE